METVRRFAPVAVLVVLLAACGAPSPSGGGGDDEVLIPPTTEVLSDDAREALTSVGADGTLTFAAASGVGDALEADDVVVSEPTPAAPEGLLRRVTAVRTEGDEVIVETAGATLRDAVHEGSLHVSVRLQPSDLERSVALHSGVTVQDFSHTIDTDFGTGGLLQATGSLTIDPILDLDIGLSCNDKFLGVCVEIPDLNVRVRVGVTETAELTIEGSEELDFDEELPIAAHDFAPMTFFIGPVPVVLTPRLVIYLTASGSLSAELTFDATQDLTLAGGFEYDSDTGFDDLSQTSSSFDHGGVDFAGEAEARAAIGGRYQIRLYGVIGPFGSLEAGPRLQANVAGLPGTASVLWELEGCLTGTVGIDSVDVLDLSYEAELFDACTTIASDDNDPPFVVIQTPSPGTQHFVGETFTLRGAASDPDDQEVDCAWTSSLGGDPLPLNGCEVEVAFASEGTRTLTLTGTDPAGATDTDTVTITIDPVPDVLPVIASPDDGEALGPGSVITLEGSASGGTAPYQFDWSVAWPTDDAGNGGDLYAIGSGASLEWTVADTLDLPGCEFFSWGRVILQVTDADGFMGSRSVIVSISLIC